MKKAILSIILLTFAGFMMSAPLSFWYLIPGGSSEIEADIEGAKRKTR